MKDESKIMLIVKVEVWPDGNEDEGFEIGRMTIANMSNVDDMSHYSAELDGKRRAEIKHRRAEGAWKLVWKALNAVGVGR